MNTDAVLRFVRKHPGFTCEQLAAKMGESPALLSVMLRQLRKAGQLVSEGHTRGTKWSAALKK
jgi:DNA-binding IclR family transcriptional regulator